jgi:methionyl-tRNA formyltransferase
MKIIFFGSDDFAQQHLESLIDAGYDVAACVTQPDRAKNRGMKIVFSPIKECAVVNDIAVLQPTDLSDSEFLAELRGMGADLFVVIAYGRFLPEDVLSIPHQGSINVHGSYLPQYRGAAPINWAIINGDKETGVSIIKLNVGMDAGDIVAQRKMKIKDDDTSISLRQRMIEEGKQLLLDTILTMGKELKGRSQDLQKVTFAPKLTKEMGKIDWNKPASDIRSLIRGLLPWPTAYTVYRERMLKILDADIWRGTTKASCGEVVAILKEGIVVGTGEGQLLLKTVHLESSKKMSAYGFVVGHNIQIGDKF